jgi:predicted aldo/keto reductase-like oxidoreductase
MAGGFRELKPDSPTYLKLKRDGAMVAALRWAIRKPYISTTIPSMTDMDQLEDNLKAMGHPFTPADEKILAQRMEQIRPLYCRTCGECNGACPKGLEVANMLRILTYAEGYGQFALARERFNELPSSQASVRCGDCTDCPIQCPHGVQVQSRLSRAQELFA